MAGLSTTTPNPTGITLHNKSKVLEVSFADGQTFRIPFELMRVYSPSAEVQGHGPGQEVLQTGKREVAVIEFIFSWDYLYMLGSQQDDLWARYQQRLQAAGVERDAPMAGKAAAGGAHACGSH